MIPTIEKIKYKIDYIKQYKKTIIEEPKYVIIHPTLERKCFTEFNTSIKKSENLEDHLGLPVILSKQVKEDEIIIGI